MILVHGIIKINMSLLLKNKYLYNKTKLSNLIFFSFYPFRENDESVGLGEVDERVSVLPIILIY